LAFQQVYLVSTHCITENEPTSISNRNIKHSLFSNRMYMVAIASFLISIFHTMLCLSLHMKHS
jgi:hypothetical protein